MGWLLLSVAVYLGAGVAMLLIEMAAEDGFEPGDIVATGTPSGVGAGRRPPRWLRPGETLISAVSGVGEMRNPVRAEEPLTS